MHEDGWMLECVKDKGSFIFTVLYYELLISEALIYQCF